MPEITTWDTAADWDNLQEQTGVVHEDYPGGYRNADQLKPGYPTTAGVLTDAFAYWPLDDSDFVLDDVVGSYDFNPTGVSIGEGGVLSSTAVYFDGTDDYMYTDSAPSVTSFTLNVWAYVPSGNTRQVIMCIEDTSGGELLGIATWDSEVYKIVSYGRTPGSGSAIPTDQWTMLTLAFDGSDNTCHAYIDGQHDYTVTADSGSWLSGVDQITLGKRSTGSEYPFEGWIDEPMVIDKQLTQSEIQALYDVASGSTATTHAVPSSEEATSLTVDADVPADARLDVTVNQGDDSVTTAENTVTASDIPDGTTTYPMSTNDSFDNGYYWLDIEFSSTSPEQAAAVNSITLSSDDKDNIFVASFDADGTTYDIPVYDTGDVSRSCARFRDDAGNVGAAEIVDASSAQVIIRHPSDGKLGLETLDR